MKKGFIISLAVVLLTLVVFTGCDSNVQLLSIGSNSGNKINYTYKLFSGTHSKSISVENGKTILIDYSSEVKKGKLTLKILDPDKNVALELEANKTGTKELIAEKDGKYKLIITGSKTDGNFDVKWEIK